MPCLVPWLASVITALYNVFRYAHTYGARAGVPEPLSSRTTTYTPLRGCYLFATVYARCYVLFVADTVARAARWRPITGSLHWRWCGNRCLPRAAAPCGLILLRHLGPGTDIRNLRAGVEQQRVLPFAAVRCSANQDEHCA